VQARGLGGARGKMGNDWIHTEGEERRLEESGMWQDRIGLVEERELEKASVREGEGSQQYPLKREWPRQNVLPKLLGCKDQSFQGCRGKRVVGAMPSASHQLLARLLVQRSLHHQEPVLLKLFPICRRQGHRRHSSSRGSAPPRCGGGGAERKIRTSRHPQRRHYPARQHFGGAPQKFPRNTATREPESPKFSQPDPDSLCDRHVKSRGSTRVVGNAGDEEKHEEFRPEEG
jgi:hypothetical protein